VFNNPFDSFHNTVSEAKEEREQLDRLLTISTPRERLLVAVIGLVLVLLAAWFLFGSVHRSVAVDGVLVQPGEDLLEGNRAVQAFVWTKSDVEPRIEAGMPAVVELSAADGEASTLDGEVTAIAAVPLADGLAAFESVAPTSVHRVEIALDEGFDITSLAGRNCRIIIELGSQSPVALFGMRRF
jgi:type II secretory pathway component PulM